MQTYVGMLKATTCNQCGVTYGLDGDHMQALKDSHRTFHCPNGHRQYFPDETDEERAIRERDAARRSLCIARDQRDQRERERRAWKGSATKAKAKLARVAKGQCPECGQVFKNVRRHMARMHT